MTKRPIQTGRDGEQWARAMLTVTTGKLHRWYQGGSINKALCGISTTLPLTWSVTISSENLCICRRCEVPPTTPTCHLTPMEIVSADDIGCSVEYWACRHCSHTKPCSTQWREG